jgi:nitrous oxidase accessory protein
MRYAFIIILLVNILSASANNIQVGSGYPFATIKSALLAAKAGDTITVSAGKYKEGNIIIDKPVTLIGINMPILDGERKYEIVSIKSSNVNIKGFKLINTAVSSVNDYAAIKIYNTSHVSITGNTILNSFFGIYAQQATSCEIKDNTLTSSSKIEQQSGNGIHCWKSDSMTIINNTVSGHRDGIYFEFVTHSVIWRNYSFKNIRYGLHFMFSNDDSYITNIFENNGAGVAVMFSHGVKMFNNYFRQNWGDASYGILLKEISDSHIQGNRFENNTSAIYMEGASRIMMERNSFISNGWGLKIQASCMDITLRNNDFVGNSFDVGTNGSLVLNTFDKNYWDKYEGYDLNKDNQGDVPFRPVSLYSMIIEKNPPAMILFRSFITTLMDKTEKIIPSITPENLKDEHPLMKRNIL